MRCDAVRQSVTERKSTTIKMKEKKRREENERETKRRIFHLQLQGLNAYRAH